MTSVSNYYEYLHFESFVAGDGKTVFSCSISIWPTHEHKAIGDSRLHPQVRNLAAPPGITLYLADSEPVSAFAPLCENMTPSTQPEMHNVLHCRQRRIEPRPQLTCTGIENFVKFGRAVFETCERAERPTDYKTRLIAIGRTALRGEAK